MVLNKTLESPLDSKEIKPVHPKGNQPCKFIGRIEAEAEAPTFGQLMQRADSLGKTLSNWTTSWTPTIIFWGSIFCYTSTHEFETAVYQFILPGPRGSLLFLQFSSVQLLSRAQLFVTPWIAAHQASLSITNSQSSLKLMSIESVISSNCLIFCHPLLLLLSIIPAWGSFHESVLRIRWPKDWSFSFSISPSSEYSELISFRMDWLDLLAVQGLSRVFSNTAGKKHQFFGAQLSL